MPKPHIPEEVKHVWLLDPNASSERYKCAHCSHWTANLPKDKDNVCPSRDRRKGPANRRR